MALIPTGTPVNVNKTFDNWFIPAIGIQAPQNGPWSVTAIFKRSRETEEVVTTTNEAGETVPLLDRNGEAVKVVEFLVQGDESTQRQLNISDVQKLARDKAAAGDTSLKDAIDTLLTHLAGEGFAQGVIS